MQTIKKYWKHIVIAVTALFMFIISIIKLANNNNLKKTEEQIKDNDAELNKLKGKSERVTEEKKTVKKQVTQNKKKVSNLESKKKTAPKKKRTTAQSKNNIINKTKRK
jgi:predicted RNase H-like nuclease (RuvC/YqgF family)